MHEASGKTFQAVRTQLTLRSLWQRRIKPAEENSAADDLPVTSAAEIA